MALTEDEQRRLDEIAGVLRRTDADLELALTSGRLGAMDPRNRRLRRAGVLLVTLSLGCLTAAFALQQQLLCLGAWLVFTTGMVLHSIAE